MGSVSHCFLLDRHNSTMKFVIVLLALAAVAYGKPHGIKPRYQDFAVAAAHSFGPRTGKFYSYGDHTVGIGSWGFTRKKDHAVDFGGHLGHGHGYHIQPYSYKDHKQFFRDFGVGDHVDVISHVVRVPGDSPFAYRFEPAH